MRSTLLAALALAVGSLGSAHLRAQSPTDAIHYRIEIGLDFATQTFHGTNTATFRSEVGGLTSIDLDLSSLLAVSAVRMGGQPVTFTRPTDQIHVTLDRAYQLNEQFSVEVDYGGSPPPTSGFAGIVFTTHSGSPMAWTLSEPFDASNWWPGKDVLVDKATFEMWVTHPDTMICASNGVLDGVDPLPANRARSRWREDSPMAAYLASFAVTNFQRRTDTYTHMGANMPVEFYVFPESWSSWQTGMNRVVPMLTAFSNVFGQYPWTSEKYGIAQFTWGGGMEHQTVASQVSVDEFLTAHELAHQWWGDQITCATWHDIWLNEGFATFAEAIWAEQRDGSLASYLARMIQNKPRTTTGTVYVYDISNVNSIFNGTNVYDKGGWVLHMLRGTLGDTDFFNCLSAYRAAYANGSATTDDFRRVCEQTTGRDLTWFFDQWVMNGGSPSYYYGFRNQQVGGVSWLHLELDQTQTQRPVFIMPVRVVVQTTAGPETHIAWNDERQDRFALRLAAPATSVSIDPEQWVLRSTPRSQTYVTPFFAAEPEVVDTVAGADITYHIDHGTAGAARPYLVVLGMTGSAPGTSVLGLTIPVNFDALTDAALWSVGTPTFPNFLGNLDAGGQGVATFRLPPGIATSAAGITITGAYLFVDAFDYASRPVSVALR